MTESPYEPALLRWQDLTEETLHELNALMDHLADGKPRKRLERYEVELMINDPADGARIAVVRHHGRIVSCAVMSVFRLMQYPRQRFGYINDVATLPEHEGKGLAKQVMQALFDAADKDNFGHVDWTTRKPNARKLYEGRTMVALGVKPRDTTVYRYLPRPPRDS